MKESKQHVFLTEEQEIIFFENIAKTVIEEKLYGDQITKYFDNQSDTFAKFLIRFEKYKWFSYDLGFEILGLVETFLETYIDIQTSRTTFLQKIEDNHIENGLDNKDEDIDPDDEDGSDWWKK